MAFFEALQNPNISHNGDYANGNTILVKDGFSWTALIFTPFWLMFHGMWLIFVMYIGVTFSFYALAEFRVISPDIIFWLNVSVSIIFAFEANFLRKWTLERKNYQRIGVSLGANIREAEVNFFSQFIQTGAPTPPAFSSTNNDIQTSDTTPPTKKSHWKIGGKRDSDSVVGMFSDN